MLNDEMLRQVGLFVGIFFKLALPGLIVWYNTKDFEWDHKYTKQAILAAAVAFGGLAMSYTNAAPTLTGAELFWQSVKDGILLNVTMNQLNKWDDVRVKKMVKEMKDNE